MSGRDDLRIAWAGTRPGDGTALDAADHAAGIAAAEGAALLLLPEAHLGGPWRSDGPETASLAGLARRHRIALACGYLEDGAGGPFSSALVLDRDGHAVGHARRTHADPDRPAVPGRGGWLAIVPVLGRRLGLIVGSDLLAPEVARALVVCGADLLLALQAAPVGPATAALATARALESRVPLVLAAPGGGLAVAADGTALGAGRTVADVPPAADPAALARWRRPELYRALAEPGPSSQASVTRRR